jgi:DNA-binding NtrC family response regulator
MSSIILLLDGEKNILKSAQTELEEDGHTVLVTRRARESLKLIEKCRPDVMVMEIRLSDVDGVEFLKLLARRHKNTPVVIHTDGHVTSDIRSLADAYVEKSHDFKGLKDTVQSILGQRSRPRYQGPERRSGKDRRMGERRKK